MPARRAPPAAPAPADRYVAAFMAGRCGAEFAARVSGATRFGLFVTVIENGASGIVPRSSLPEDYWRHDETTQSLIGTRTGLTFRLGQPMDVRLKEANPVTGGLVFEVLQGVPGKSAGRAGRTGRRKRR